MTELEKIIYAKKFIDKLANGVNPIDNTLIPEDDIVNNIHITRCFFFVSDILRQVIGTGGTNKKSKSNKIPFTLTLEQSDRFLFSVEPIPVSEIARRIRALVEDENMERLSYKHINEWLINIGMLQLEDDGNGKLAKRPTQAGNEIGITIKTRLGRYGGYKVVVYNENAQRFILDNIDAIGAITIRSKTKSKDEN